MPDDDDGQIQKMLTLFIMGVIVAIVLGLGFHVMLVEAFR